MFLTIWIIFAVGLVIFGLGTYFFNITDKFEELSIGMILVGLIIVALDLGIGLGVNAHQVETFSVKKLHVKEITRSKTKVFVEIEGTMTMTFNSKEDYDNLDSNTIFYYVKKYDYYGNLKYSYKDKDTIFKKYCDGKKRKLEILND